MAGFQEVAVNRDLIFKGAARYQPNVMGPMMTEYKIFDETFMADASEHDWDEEEANGTTITHSAVDGGAETITASGTEDDCGELSHTAQWSAERECGMEVKLKVSQITEVCVCAGFVDAKQATNDQVAGEISGTALQDRVSDSALWIFDTDQDVDVWYVAAANAGTEGTPVAATGSLQPVADTYIKLRVQTDDAGNVTFTYGTVVGGVTRYVQVGYLPTAIAFASTDLLTPYVGCISRTTSALTVTVSRITTWQKN